MKISQKIGAFMVFAIVTFGMANAREQIDPYEAYSVLAEELVITDQGIFLCTSDGFVPVKSVSFDGVTLMVVLDGTTAALNCEHMRICPKCRNCKEPKCPYRCRCK